jgi:hypothetical protein
MVLVRVSLPRKEGAVPFFCGLHILNKVFSRIGVVTVRLEGGRLKDPIVVRTVYDPVGEENS